MPPKAGSLIWIDLEMTGLNTAWDGIIEIATVVTDADLNVIAEGPMLAIQQPEEMLAGMDEWNTRQHTKSGLVERVRNSTITVAEAERQTIDFLRRHVGRNESPMCGSSICQDRRFLARLMPELEAYFHYRNLDVSTLKELALRWAPDVAASFKKRSSHLALEDIHDSIRELRHYREHLLKVQLPTVGAAPPPRINPRRSTGHRAYSARGRASHERVDPAPGASVFDPWVYVERSDG
jgi:oligoribonuclease